MIEAAKSGHPGIALGMADVLYILFKNHLVFNPSDPSWRLRDRLIFSAGHGSALLYSCLYLSGYKDFNIDQIKRFRSLHSNTPGHPEFSRCNNGVEATTGPLGQGIGMAVGMAMASKISGDTNKIFVICGDGCLAEGISQEAISFAGHYNLNNLVVIFDDNNITIDGSTSLSSSCDHATRFGASGWDVILSDGHNYDEIDSAITQSKGSKKPVMIAFKTIIGFGIASLEGSCKIHGAAVGPENISIARRRLMWDSEPFDIPDDILLAWRSFWLRNEKLYDASYNFTGRQQDVELNWDAVLKSVQMHSCATRVSSAEVIESLLMQSANILGGSADLSSSNNTRVSMHQDITRDHFDGNYIHYGIREHLMAAACNGILLYDGSAFKRPYCGTFLVFSDYMRPAIRLSALMGLPVIYIFTHDSIGVGEDGPTHQPVEQIASLRMMPNMLTIRPCSPLEVVCAWRAAIENTTGPTSIILSRQKIEYVNHLPISYEDFIRGAYKFYGASDAADVVICATGSEVHLAYLVAIKLEKQSLTVRVVSVPSVERFLLQPRDYVDSMIGNCRTKCVIEAGIRFGWDRILKDQDLFFGVDDFGISGKCEDVFNAFGLNLDNITQSIINSLKFTSF